MSCDVNMRIKANRCITLKKTMLPDNKKVGFLIFTATKSLKDVGSSYDKFVLRGYYKILQC